MKNLCGHCIYTWYANCRARHADRTIFEKNTGIVSHCEFFTFDGPYKSKCSSCKSLIADVQDKNCIDCFNQLDQWTGDGYECETD